MRRRGYSLLDAMIAVALLGIGTLTLTSYFSGYERANRRALVVEQTARELDQEMERFRACADRACVEWLVAQPVTSVVRALAGGPNGTLEVTLTSTASELRKTRRLKALLWVDK